MDKSAYEATISKKDESWKGRENDAQVHGKVTVGAYEQAAKRFVPQNFACLFGWFVGPFLHSGSQLEMAVAPPPPNNGATVRTMLPQSLVVSRIASVPGTKYGDSLCCRVCGKFCPV